MKIGEVADQLKTTTRTLRFYEELGMVTPKRSERGTRYYEPDDVDRFKVILELASADIPIREIQQFSSIRQACSTGDEASHQVESLLNTVSNRLDEKLRIYQQMDAQVKKALEQVQDCFGCQKPPTKAGCAECPVAAGLTGSNSASFFRIVWDK
jgi:DNA-binding transcriptional MerR regulator